jgi:hypothetical protein
MLTPLKHHFQYQAAVLREILAGFPQHDFSSSTMETFINPEIRGKHFGYLVGKDVAVTWSIHVGHTTHVAMNQHLDLPTDPRKTLEDDIARGDL